MYLWQNKNRLTLTLSALIFCALLALFAWREHQTGSAALPAQENATFAAATKEQATAFEPGVLPSLSKNQIALHSSATIKDGITLYQALEIAGARFSEILSVRSLGPLYPDGTCIRFELLLRDGKSLLRKTIDKEGVIIVGRVTNTVEPKTAFPATAPNSPEALKELVTNTYFAQAKISGLAIYWDAQSTGWKYVIQTDLGNVSIVIPG